MQDEYEVASAYLKDILSMYTRLLISTTLVCCQAEWCSHFMQLLLNCAFNSSYTTCLKGASKLFNSQINPCLSHKELENEFQCFLYKQH